MVKKCIFLVIYLTKKSISGIFIIFLICYLSSYVTWNIFCLNFDDYGLLLMKILRASPKIKVSKKDLQYKKPNFWYLTSGSITINYCIIAAWRGSLWHCWSITEAQAFIAAFSSFFIFYVGEHFWSSSFFFFLKDSFLFSFLVFCHYWIVKMDKKVGRKRGGRHAV